VRRLLVIAAALLLAGCEAPPVYGPSPTPPVEPFFANKQEALDAVDAFMKEYVVASTTMVTSHGVDQAALEKLVTPEQLAEERAALDQLASQGLTPAGNLGYFGVEIQQFQQDSATEAYVQAYVCIDYRETHYVRSDGSIFEGGLDWYPAEAILYATSSKQLTLHELRKWTGRDFCEQRS
jgi:hypothetical protein